MKEIFPRNQRKLEIDAPGKQQQSAIRIKRTLADMPVPAKQLNVISVVCLYTLIGMSDREIAEAVKTDVESLNRIKMLEAYQTVYDMVVKSIIDEEAGDVRNLFAAHARNAASNLVDLADGAKNEAVKLKANMDLLDRAGHRPADVVQVKHTMENALQVVYVEEKSDFGDVIDGEAVSFDER